MGFSPSEASTILSDHIQRFGTNTYIGLLLEEPTIADGGADFNDVTEPPAEAGYSRVRVMIDDKRIKAQIANKEYIFFPETLASWGTIKYFALFDSETITKPFFYGELTEPVTITVSGDNTYVPIFRPHSLVIGLDKKELESYDGLEGA